MHHLWLVRICQSSLKKKPWKLQMHQHPPLSPNTAFILFFLGSFTANLKHEALELSAGAYQLCSIHHYLNCDDGLLVHSTHFLFIVLSLFKPSPHCSTLNLRPPSFFHHYKCLILNQTALPDPSHHRPLLSSPLLIFFLLMLWMADPAASTERWRDAVGMLDKRAKKAFTSNVHFMGSPVF